MGHPAPQSGTPAPRSSSSYCCVFFANADGFASAHGEQWCVVLPVGVSLSVLMSGDAGLRNRPALSSAVFGKRFGKIGVGPAVSPSTSGRGRTAPSAPATTPATGSPLTPPPPLGRPPPPPADVLPAGRLMGWSPGAPAPARPRLSSLAVWTTAPLSTRCALDRCPQPPIGLS